MLKSTNGRHIRDWEELNRQRRLPQLELIRTRLKPGRENAALALWEGLDQKSIPALLIEVTSLCRNACSFCAVQMRSLGDAFVMDDLRHLLDLLILRGLCSCWLTGGEPLHHFVRTSTIINVLLDKGIDVERISTSFIASQRDIDRLAHVVNHTGKANTIFRCTVSISINSYLDNSPRDGQTFINRFETWYEKLDHNFVNVHFPVIIDIDSGIEALSYVHALSKKHPHLTYSYKSLVPSSLDSVWRKYMRAKDLNKTRLMDCTLPSLFPCTWPMWHLSANGGLFCCSTWYNDEDSHNFIGNIENHDLCTSYSEFMKTLTQAGGWLPFWRSLPKDQKNVLDDTLIPDFSDNTQKCFVCRYMMRLFSEAKTEAI